MDLFYGLWILLLDFGYLNDTLKSCQLKGEKRSSLQPPSKRRSYYCAASWYSLCVE